MAGRLGEEGGKGERGEKDTLLGSGTVVQPWDALKAACHIIFLFLHFILTRAPYVVGEVERVASPRIPSQLPGQDKGSRLPLKILVWHSNHAGF